MYTKATKYTPDPRNDIEWLTSGLCDLKQWVNEKVK